jgi:hypothetical protein
MAKGILARAKYITVSILPRGEMMKSKSIIFAILFILLAGIVSAIEFVPQGNINGKDTYGIFNFRTINGTALYQAGFKVLDTNSTITVSSNYSSFSNQTIFWSGVSSYIARWFYSVSNILYFNESLANNLWNDTAGINGLNSSKLNITDQRYNESSGINGLNSSKLDATDQRYNETASANLRVFSTGDNMTGNLNMTTHNLTDISKIVYSSTANNILPGTTGYNGTCWRAVGSTLTFAVC